MKIVREDDEEHKYDPVLPSMKVTLDRNGTAFSGKQRPSSLKGEHDGIGNDQEKDDGLCPTVQEC